MLKDFFLGSIGINLEEKPTLVEDIVYVIYSLVEKLLKLLLMLDAAQLGELESF